MFILDEFQRIRDETYLRRVFEYEKQSVFYKGCDDVIAYMNGKEIMLKEIEQIKIRQMEELKSKLEKSKNSNKNECIIL